MKQEQRTKQDDPRQPAGNPPAGLTKSQRVTVRVCDEWLKEAGMPLYSELLAKAK